MHAHCVRIGAHSNSDAQDLYRSEEQIKAAAIEDPLVKLTKLLKKMGVKEAAFEKIDTELSALIEKACADAEKAAPPSAESVSKFVYAEAYPPPKKEQDYQPLDKEANEKLREAINRTLIEEFEHNENIFFGARIALPRRRVEFLISPRACLRNLAISEYLTRQLRKIISLALPMV